MSFKNKIFVCSALLFSLVMCSSLGYSQYNTDPSTPETPDPRAVAIKPTLLQINKIVISEIETGIAALQQKDIKTALESFITAIDIAPYEPMSYILLMKTLIAMGEEDMAFKWLEKSGRNLSDSNQIIASLNSFLMETPPVQNINKPVFIAPFRDNKRCAVSFIFDDGEPSISTDVLPLFEKHGYRTTVAINPGVTPDDSDSDSRASWKAWFQANKTGHEIANHGMNHKPLPGLAEQDLTVEVLDSFNLIKKKIGQAPESFVFPQDEATPELVRYVEKDHLVARDHDSLHEVYPHICIPIYGGKRFSKLTARILIDIAMNRRLWLIPQCHGLYTPTIKKSFKAISKDLLVDQLDYIQENVDKIWMARFIDVYKYLKEAKETQLSIQNLNQYSADISLKNTLDKNMYNEPLTVVINLPLNEKPRSIKAFETSTKKQIPARFVDQFILLDVTPSDQTVHVEWE